MKTMWALTALVVVLGIVGWIMNLVQVISLGSVELTVLYVLKIVGIFIPFLGAILGYV